MINLQDIINSAANEDTQLLQHVAVNLGDVIKNNLNDDDYVKVCRNVYETVNGGHYDKNFADWQIPKLYYVSGNTENHAPYWTEDKVKEFYDNHKSEIPQSYNFYDFEVTLNMIKSDDYNIIENWFAGQDNDDRYVELAINWLNDEDNPFGNEKIWKYLNSKG